MTKTTTVAALAALLLAAAPALAVPDTLTVDIDRILSESAAAKGATTQLKAKYDPQIATRRAAFQTAGTAYQSQVQAARAAVAAKPGTPVPPATQTSLQQAGEKAQAAQESLQQLGQEVQNVEGYVRQQIIEHVTPIAEQLRNERKASAVIPKSSMLASDPAGDITTVLIQRLDQSFPTASITLPQPPAGQGR